MAKTFDLIIIGGGLVGMTTAIGAAQAGLSVAVIDRQASDTALAPAFDGRASALAFATQRMLDALGVWQHMADFAEPINEIRVSDGPIGRASLMHLHFDHAQLGDGPLGYMVENRHTRIALDKTLSETQGITLFAPDSAVRTHRTPERAAVTLASGQEISAPLLIAADGRASQMRREAGIQTRDFHYNQVGIVTSIALEIPHDSIAHERFLPSGPFAILPLRDNKASLVWTEKTHLADTIMGLSERAFEAEVQRRCGDFLGKVSVASGRWCYPLSLSFAETITAERLALVGDAAHGIHPIAGQGLNLGLRDVAALLEVVADRARLGLDIGAADTLSAYAQWRHADNASLMGVTDLLNRLFSNNIGPVAHARDLGLAIVNKIPPLKGFFMSHARGTIGKLPRLLKGEHIA